MILGGFILSVIILNPLSVKAAENIPGINSSFLKYNAENNAVPTTINVLAEWEGEVYSNYMQNEEKLVKNNTINVENVGGDGNVAQVTRLVVWIGVLLCIGMLGFLILF
jgi:hypothetical protein